MPKSPSILPLAALLAFAVVVGFGLDRVQGADETGGKKVAGVEKALHAMIKALVANDYPAFIATGGKELSTRISEHRFALMREDTATSLKNGYTAAIDVEVPEADGSVSYHWKITPRKGDELHAILIVKKDKVHDFSLE